MNNLIEYRDHIDRIDQEILRLFEERMKVSEQVAEYKIETGKKVLDPQREHDKIEKLKNMANTNELGVQELFQQIMAISRKKQYELLTKHGVDASEDYQFTELLPMEQINVVFQGVTGAYSHAAARTYFGNDVSCYPVKTWRDAMEEVVTKKADYAVLPIENSTAGAVEDIYDLLTEYKLYIVGEQVIRVDHVLLGTEDAQLQDLDTIYSHEQGLMQCKRYLELHKNWRTAAVENTAGAAKKVSEEKLRNQAAIASREAGEIFGLKILAENICENTQNSTRFIIVSRRPIYRTNADKISVCFELLHETGSLYNMLSHIIYNGLSMTKIESRPITGRTWEYRFFVDFEGNLTDSAVKNAIKGMEAEALMFRILGNY